MVKLNQIQIYTFLCVFFSVLIVTGNLIYQKFVTMPISHFYSFELSVGAILYPLTFLTTDLIAEFYGREKASFCVKLGIIMNITVALIILLFDNLESTSWSKVDNSTFHKVFGVYSVAFLGSILACYISQSIDIRLYLFIKKITQGKYLAIRNCISTAVSLLIDTCVVISFMTFFGALPPERMWVIISSSYLFKLFFTITSAPLFYLCVVIIRKISDAEPAA